MTIGNSAEIQSGICSWSIVDGVLAYRSESGSIHNPTSIEIWKAQFSTNKKFGLKPSDCLTGIAFSRFPAELTLNITGSPADTLSIAITARMGISSSPFPDYLPDQIIMDSVWFPVSVSDYLDTISALGNMLIPLHGTITMGQYIWLKSRKDFGMTIVDRSDPWKPSEIHAPKDFNARLLGLDADLYKYQKDGVFFLMQIAQHGIGCILGDEMGLGKTMQVITLLLSEKMGKRSPSLIIAPATLIENWRRELSAFGPGLTVLVHVGQGRAGIHSELSGFDIVITSYDTAVRDETILSSILWDILVIDEAQNIKTPRAQRTLSIKSLPRRVSVAVTGTPVENSLTDLWSLSDFVLPGLLGDVNSFKSVFSDSLSDASALSGIVAPLLLRRRIREVARDLPPKIDIPQVVVMTESMAEGYERIRSDVLQEYGSSATLVSLQKLRMFCAHPILADFPCHDPAADMPKYIRLLEILEEIFAVGEKCLVFTGYTGMIDLLVRDLKVRFEDSFVDFVDGRVPVAERLPVVDRFSSFNGSGALILNPRAAGVGLNITTANHVIHYNPEWNPALEDQASARAYRRKQERPVTIHHFYFADTIEEVIVNRLDFKRGLSRNAATGHTGDASGAEIARALAVSPLSIMRKSS